MVFSNLNIFDHKFNDFDKRLGKGYLDAFKGNLQNQFGFIMVEPHN
jgi:hypothetical protein